MINPSSIKSYIENIKICYLWLEPESLSVKEICNTINDFSSIITFTIHPKTEVENIINNIAILIDDIIEIQTLPKNQKEEEILKLIREYHNDTQKIKSLAKKAIHQIDLILQQYEEKVNNEWLEGKYNPEAIKLLDEYKLWNLEHSNI